MSPYEESTEAVKATPERLRSAANGIAALTIHDHRSLLWSAASEIERLRAAVTEEREACAQVADAKRAELWNTVSGGIGTHAAQEIAEQIRARLP